MVRLFSISGTCAASVQIVLEWTGNAYELVLLARGQNRQPEFLSINPSGQVPAVELDNGYVLTEASAILIYLADLHPEAHLAPAREDLIGWFELNRMISLLTGELHPAFKPFFSPQRFLDDEAQFSRLKAHAFLTLDPLLRDLDSRLRGKQYLFGRVRSIADAYLYVLLRWVDNAPDGIAAYSELSRYRAAMEADPGVLKTLRMQQMPTVGRGT